MVDKKLIEGNKLIAEFMNYTAVIPIAGNGTKDIELKPIIELDEQYHYPSSLKYHYRWDWLMPVVNKISEYRLAYPTQADWVCNCKVVVHHKILWREVVAFIEWFNKNTKGDGK